MGLKIHRDCAEYEAIGCILLRDIVRFLVSHGIMAGKVGEIYFAGAEPKKAIDLEITAAMLEELGIEGRPV